MAAATTTAAARAVVKATARAPANRGRATGRPERRKSSAADRWLPAAPPASARVTQAQRHRRCCFRRGRGRNWACYEACASAWPPLTTTGKPAVMGGAESSKLGTTKRSDGTMQVTYRGVAALHLRAGAPSGEADGTDVKAFGASWYPLHSNGEKPRVRDGRWTIPRASRIAARPSPSASSAYVPSCRSLISISFAFGGARKMLLLAEGRRETAGIELIGTHPRKCQVQSDHFSCGLSEGSTRRVAERIRASPFRRQGRRFDTCRARWIPLTDLFRGLTNGVRGVDTLRCLRKGLS